jgi:hypothetical protein
MKTVNLDLMKSVGQEDGVVNFALREVTDSTWLNRLSEEVFHIVNESIQEILEADVYRHVSGAIASENDAFEQCLSRIMRTVK